MVKIYMRRSSMLLSSSSSSSSILFLAAQDVVVHFAVRAIDSYWGWSTPGGAWDGARVVVGKSNSGRESARVRVA
jgi:hypothetical protein